MQLLIVKCPNCEQEIAPDEKFCGNCGTPRPEPGEGPHPADHAEKVIDGRFKKVEDEYLRLKGQLAAGRLTPEQFEHALEKLIIQDVQGNYWMLGTESGQWYRHDGQEWVRADPPVMDSKKAPPAQSHAVLQKVKVPPRKGAAIGLLVLATALVPVCGACFLVILGTRIGSSPGSLAISLGVTAPTQTLQSERVTAPTGMPTSESSPSPVFTRPLEPTFTPPTLLPSSTFTPPLPTPTLVPTVTPSRTPTSVPTVTRTPTRTPVPPTRIAFPVTIGCPGGQGRRIFFDDFTNPKSGWTEYHGTDYEVLYENGEFHLTVWEGTYDGFAWIQFRDLTSRYRLEVKARQLSGINTNEYGLMFGGQDDNNYYTFLISDLGSYRIDKKVDAKSQVIKPPVTSGVVNNGALNALGLIVEGTKITVCLNGQVLTTTADPALKPGRVGVSAGGDIKPLHVHFDDFGVWKLE